MEVATGYNNVGPRFNGVKTFRVERPSALTRPETIRFFFDPAALWCCRTCWIRSPANAADLIKAGRFHLPRRLLPPGLIFQMEREKLLRRKLTRCSRSRSRITKQPQGFWCSPLWYTGIYKYNIKQWQNGSFLNDFPKEGTTRFTRFGSVHFFGFTCRLWRCRWTLCGFSRFAL